MWCLLGVMPIAWRYASTRIFRCRAEELGLPWYLVWCYGVLLAGTLLLDSDAPADLGFARALCLVGMFFLHKAATDTKKDVLH